MTWASPADVVQAQLDSYNAKNIDTLLDTYGVDAEQFMLHGALLARGREQIRSRLQPRFSETDLQAQLLSRTCMSNVVIDHERVTRNFPDGLGTVEMLCIYEVRDGRIHAASFALGEKKLAASDAKGNLGSQADDGSCTGQRPRVERAPDEPA